MKEQRWEIFHGGVSIAVVVTDSRDRALSVISHGFHIPVAQLRAELEHARGKR